MDGGKNNERFTEDGSCPSDPAQSFHFHAQKEGRSVTASYAAEILGPSEPRAEAQDE